MVSAVQRVADRHLIRLAAHQALAERPRVAALQDLTPQVLAAFAEGFYLPQHEGRVAFNGLVTKLKQLTQAFTRMPKLWQKFKGLLGIESLTDLPGAVRDLAAKGFAVLKNALHKVFYTMPGRIFTVTEGKLRGVKELIDDLIHKYPAFDQFMGRAKVKVDSFDQWLRSHLPVVSRVLLVAVYCWIWFNVVEFEWDLKGLTDAVMGNLTLAELLASLPSSGLGFLMNVFNLGTFTLLPVTVFVRIAYFVAHRYAEWDGHSFRINRERLAEDFGVPLSEPIPATL